MSLLPIIKQTKVNLAKGQIRARKNLEKILNRRLATQKKNPEKPEKSGFL
jgi:hypothetical protein